MTAGSATGETLDTLFDGRLKFYQSASGYRVSLDAVLLAFFATIRRGDRIADLGSGNGVVPLLLASLYVTPLIVGVEIQAKMVERATRNIALNQLAGRVRIVRCDVRAIRRCFDPESFSVVVANPPYRRALSGRVSPDREKSIARHEVRATVGDFVRAGAYLLPIKGRMAFIYSAGRAMDLLEVMRDRAIEPKRVRMVHSFAATRASLILVEGVKGGRSGIEVLPPLTIYERGMQYTEEVARMLAGERIGRGC
jgi:tRNA1Val (adenine37-N6)-methyltransferase